MSAHHPDVLRVLRAAELAYHRYTAGDGHAAIQTHSNTEAADRALAALEAAGFDVVPVGSVAVPEGEA